MSRVQRKVIWSRELREIKECQIDKRKIRGARYSQRDWEISEGQGQGHVKGRSDRQSKSDGQRKVKETEKVRRAKGGHRVNRRSEG